MQNDSTPGQEERPESEVRFLPVNQVTAPVETVRQRAYLSCDACRQRKTRCTPATTGQRQPCRRCTAEERVCHFRNSRATISETSHLAEDTQVSGTSHPMGPEDETPGDDDGFQPMDESVDQPASTLTSTTIGSNHQSTARSRILAARLHDTADGLDLLTLAAAGVQNEAQDADTNGPENSEATQQPPGQSRHTWPKTITEADWKRFILIKKGVLSKAEIIEYLDFYFAVLWPLRPIVHTFFAQKSHYGVLAVEEPLLLTGLVTLASRYHNLGGGHGEIRSERIHWQSWRFLQKYLQSALWGSPVTRSLGSITAMLLMIEWHSKSINNPLGLSDGDDYELFNIPESEQREGSDGLSSPTSRQQFGMTTLLEKLNIVAPAYRSNKMSWMLLSSAIALAQESRCFEQDSRELSGKLSTYESFKQEWNQIVCVFIHLADESLSVRLGLETLLPAKSIDAVRGRFSTSFASLLPESALWESYHELFLEARKARELLLSLKKSKAAIVARAVLPDLEHVDRGLSRWRRHFGYSIAEQGLLSACVHLEYQYLVMYSLAPASDVLPSLGDSEDMKSRAVRDLAKRATGASREMLTILIHTLEPSGMLKYVPVRVWQFLVAANLHLLKTTLAVDAMTSDLPSDIRLLRASIAAFRKGSPDDTHMAIRYARFLEIILTSSHHFSRAETPTGGVNEGAAGEAGDVFSAADGAGGDLGTTLYMSSLADLNMPDLVHDLGNIGDLVDWPGGPFGMFGGVGFLPPGTN
ncbi:hypothetical protein F5X68DRAFT_177918 [Plectosphaerella plurivora]|uniref:Zn(2)-C6 fungal-type domain-containing protein n=1 Tax=Plectosphaerella plurivora TaxID=936078 RepID=A0A9P8V1A9_9PEZI|nr:hypothetical protein F5X68DRAFT_177918 [Plectosphaerella plurivora]